MQYVSWSNLRDDANWLNYPLDCWLMQEMAGDVDESEVKNTIGSDSSKLVMFCASGSDFWQRTSYGFERDSGHAYLGATLVANRAIEVGFSIASFKGQFDQGGILVRQSDQNWLKAGVELSDGILQLSAVATKNGFSDWSTAAWPREWDGKDQVIIKVSRLRDALIVKIRLLQEDEHPDNKWRLLRVCPVPTDAVLRAGPYSCAPTREGLYVEFLRYTQCDADELH
jgi:regulation of enolase protein 1 (concanavalin A-like superfamily)